MLLAPDDNRAVGIAAPTLPIGRTLLGLSGLVCRSPERIAQ